MVNMVGRMHFVNEIINMIYFLEVQRSEIELISGFYLHSIPCFLCWQMLIPK